MTFPEQSEAQQLICNINIIREKVYGETYSFEYYENFSIKQLRTMQEQYLAMYNSLSN